MNEDMKFGYNVGLQRINEELDTMIDEIHNAYMHSTNERAKDRLNAQMSILWNVKSRVEDVIADSIEITKDEQPKADWIPCEDRLPSESGYYFACIYSEDVDDFDFRKTWFAHVLDYDIEESEWRELYDFETVTAWQPLPQPYKKDRSGEVVEKVKPAWKERVMNTFLGGRE